MKKSVWVVYLWCISSVTLFAQGTWLPGDGFPGICGPVYATTVWDPDGIGPSPELLIAGGSFKIAGNVFASNIAAWDGISWQPLGNGMNDIVSALTVYNGQLIASG
jgi:hypothetical protein